MIGRPSLASAGPGRTGWLVASGLVAIGLLGGIGWFALRPGGAPPWTAPPPVAPAVIAKPVPVLAAEEADILAARPGAWAVFRWSHAPSVLVLSFGSFSLQADMLNRVGALVEKAGLPRERVLNDAELAAAIRRDGDTPETFYYGHDYRAADLARFFALADAQHLALRPQEEFLRGLLLQEGLLQPGAVGALISIPPLIPGGDADWAGRAAILRHELSHGIYFTSPAYADWVATFWSTILTAGQRQGFRRFLASQEYDTANEDLMRNEAAAYLVHTPDLRYFRPDVAGLSDDEASLLRHAFREGMPDGWLKQNTPDPEAPSVLSARPG
jgi:hypothetical protein